MYVYLYMCVKSFIFPSFSDSCFNRGRSRTTFKTMRQISTYTNIRSIKCHGFETTINNCSLDSCYSYCYCIRPAAVDCSDTGKFSQFLLLGCLLQNICLEIGFCKIFACWLAFAQYLFLRLAYAKYLSLDCLLQNICPKVGFCEICLEIVFYKIFDFKLTITKYSFLRLAFEKYFVLRLAFAKYFVQDWFLWNICLYDCLLQNVSLHIFCCKIFVFSTRVL